MNQCERLSSLLGSPAMGDLCQSHSAHVNSPANVTSTNLPLLSNSKCYDGRSVAGKVIFSTRTTYRSPILSFLSIRLEKFEGEVEDQP